MADRRYQALSNESSSSESGTRRAPKNVRDVPGPLQNASPRDSPPAALTQRQPTQVSTLSNQSRPKPFQSSTIPPSSPQPRQQQPSAAKIAIPRLRRESIMSQPPSVEKHRVAHACEPCRQRKSKCSGERPICKHCQDFKISCVYADGKRDRTKK